MKQQCCSSTIHEEEGITEPIKAEDYLWTRQKNIGKLSGQSAVKVDSQFFINKIN